MFQKFNTDTLMSRVVKNILATTDVPIFDTIDDGDIIVKNCFYIYKHYIVKAMSTGTFKINSTSFYPGYIYQSEQESDVTTNNFPETIEPIKDDKGTIIGYKPNPGFVDPRTIDYSLLASYQILEHDCTNQDNRKYMFKYHSKNNYYDNLTHYHLGNYLRWYKSDTSIDLMPYYNCFCGETITGVTLLPQDSVWYTDVEGNQTPTYLDINFGTPSYSLHTSKDKKCYIVPIRFGKEYTIALDSDYAVTLRPLLYKDGQLLRMNNSLPYSDYPELELATTTYARTRYRQPFIFKVNTSSYRLKQRERFLFLAIQVDSQVDSSLTVLEGNYLYTNKPAVTANKDDVIQMFPQALSLLQFNSRDHCAFSNRLIEYLLQNIIDSEDTLSGNIQYVMKSLVDIFATVTNSDATTWDNVIKDYISTVLDNVSNRSIMWDQDGNINKDIEGVLMLGGLKL